MAKRIADKGKRQRRTFDQGFKEQAVQMLLDGHSVQSVSENLGVHNTNLLYRWKKEVLRQSGQAAESLDARVRELEEQLRYVERERDILKKALAIFSRNA
jgi:transposase